jgi:hypothetical protein
MRLRGISSLTEENLLKAHLPSFLLTFEFARFSNQRNQIIYIFPPAPILSSNNFNDVHVVRIG